MTTELPLRAPLATRWPIEIHHGVLPTEVGPLGGWGWSCTAHVTRIWLHGYPSQVDMLEALSAHLGVCSGKQ